MAEASSREQKKARLKDIILKLHEGLSVSEAKARFEREVGNISSSEIAELEQSLISEGLSPEEIKKFCNVHALIFQSALEKAAVEETSPAHPVHLFKSENREIEKLLDGLEKTFEKREEAAFPDFKKQLKDRLLELRGIETHYERKEQLLFPFLEKKGFMGPSKVMWGKDNEIRDLLKVALAKLDALQGFEEFSGYIEKTLNPLVDEVRGMIFKEENILFPTSLEKLDTADWVSILQESDGIGYVFIEKPAETSQLIRHLEESIFEEAAVRDEAINLPTGTIKLAELLPLLDTIPVDITFVDAEDTVRYFSNGGKRIFLRTRAILGRKVQNCHPPQSVDVVEKILAAFKEGKRDSYEFWINFHDRLIYIRYFAVRDRQRHYLGTLEVTQDVTPIKQLEGERRLLDERD